MADNNSFRTYRSKDPYRRAPEPAHEPAGSDPLAELARLIGQNDPMADFGSGHSLPAQPAGYASREAAPQWPPAPPSAQYAPAAHTPGYDNYAPADDGYDSPLAALAARAEARRADRQQPVAPRYESEGQLETHADDRMHAQDEHAHAHSNEEEPYYENEAPLDPSEDEMYDDAPHPIRRGGIATALALIGCAVLGSAGAYGYRSYTVPSFARTSTPVITADNTPIKVPAAPAADPQSNKQISERFANAANPDNLVSRQEEPMALREPAPGAPPRVVLPSPVPTNPNPPPAAAAPPAPAANAAPAAKTPDAAPKRVRTVTIRPDGNDTSGKPVSGNSSAQSAPTPPAPPRATTHAAPAPANNGNAPLSLSPQAVGSDNAPRARTASREPVGSVGSGSYVVQLSSQKSEGDAQSSFRALQAKFPNELGDRQLIIRRADLGNKGVVYRANVGPFASASEAQHFCSSYKAAGGQCLVPNN
jgi:hypothetical protein